METIQILKYCPWISEEVNVKEYFDNFNKTLDDVNGMKPHNEKFNMEESLREFFHMPDDLEGPLSRRSTPALSLHARSASIESSDGSTGRHLETASRKNLAKNLSNKLLKEESLPLRSKSADDIDDTMRNDDDEDDPFAIKKMEEDCSIDLLNVDGELPPRDLCETGPVGDSGRVTNWYAGAFVDGVIPDAGPDKLVTLACQAKELYKRETVKDYTRLRLRLLKYASTVRMVVKKEKENSPENILLEENAPKSCLRDLVFNIRIQRPFHRKSFQKKGLHRYPTHSQEMLMLGSQTLSELRDAIVCINDVYVHEDMRENPDRNRIANLPSLRSQFPSSFIYMSGTFYTDMRTAGAVDNSETIKNWAKRYPAIGEMKTLPMDKTKLSDLSLRLGYPYVYQHLGNCEHLITITDIRLHHRTDIQNPSRYPLSRGNPIKLTVKCFACTIYLANWILKDDPRLPTPYAHLCDHCLKTFCYDDKGRPVGSFKLYPFIDEINAQDTKEKQERMAKNLQIEISGPQGPATLFIEPFLE